MRIAIQTNDFPHRMMKLSPSAFWAHYHPRIVAGYAADYQDNRRWTEFAKQQAEEVCRGAGLQTSREYFRLDVCAWTNRSAGDLYDWHLRVAFEVESGDWRDELCKLAHVHADLKVLVGYERHRGWREIDTLRERFALQKDLILRGDGQWLIIFGPDWREPTAKWSAFTFDTNGPVPIAE